jgi:hypothetical protein
VQLRHTTDTERHDTAVTRQKTTVVDMCIYVCIHIYIYVDTATEKPRQSLSVGGHIITL